MHIHRQFTHRYIFLHCFKYLKFPSQSSPNFPTLPSSIPSIPLLVVATLGDESAAWPAFDQAQTLTPELWKVSNSSKHQCNRHQNANCQSLPLYSLPLEWKVAKVHDQQSEIASGHSPFPKTKLQNSKANRSHKAVLNCHAQEILASSKGGSKGLPLLGMPCSFNLL